MLSIGIIGASGYTGVELVKIALRHPKISCIKLYGNSSSGERYVHLYPELEHLDLIIQSIDELDYNLDVYFLALPHTKSISIAIDLLKKNKFVIDLSADFRLNSCEIYSDVYGEIHTEEKYLKTKVYGLSEYISPDMYEHTNLIANPGCFPTVTLLALLPLKQIENKILTVTSSAYSGTSGAGKKGNIDLSFSELYGNTKAYSVLEHRHQPEIEQQLENCYPYSITMHLLPVIRGIYATHTVFLSEEINVQELSDLYMSHYHDSAFIRLREKSPELKWVINSNYCDLSVKVRGRTLVITSCIDNLIKGASGQAIQNMNLKLGFNETEGLL